jgi:hypothetical protein
VTATTSSEKEKVRGHCPKCGPDRWATVEGEFKKSENEGEVWAATTYRILQCPACETVYCQSDFIFSEDIDYSEHPVTGEMEYAYNHKIEHWPHTPLNKRKKPHWLDKILLVDEDVYSLISSVYVATENDLSVLAAIGIRTVFDRTSEFVGIDPAKSFAAKLSELVAVGKIGTDQRDILDILTDAGSAAAHRGWRPTPEELDTMLEVIESFLHNTFILGEAAKKLKSRLPQRHKPLVKSKKT